MKKQIQRDNFLAKLFILLQLIGLLLYGCSHSQKPQWKLPTVTHDTVPSGNYNVLWRRTNVFVGASGRNMSLVASNGSVFIYGSLDINENSSVNSLDIHNGKLLWKTDPKPPSTLYVDQEGLYVGEDGGGARTSKLDQSTGEVKWARFFLRSSGVEHLLVYNDLLYLYLAPDKREVLRTVDGKNIFSTLPDSPPFFDAQTCGEIYQTPVYTADTVYFRTNRNSQIGEICAVDITTGNLQWKTKLSVISNIAVTKRAIFVLVQDGYLSAIDPATGEELSTLQIFFDNTPFPVFGEIGNYFVAYDSNNDILVAYLGDSRQLFAFRIN